jgi:hypothetical protein
MFDIFCLQIRHILEGKRKWLVFLFLVFPVLLTYFNMYVSGLVDLKRMREEWEAYQKKPASEKTESLLKRVIPGDEPIELLGGKVTVTKDGIDFKDVPFPQRFDGKSVSRITVGDQTITIKDGQVWIGPKHSMSHPEEVPPWNAICTIYLFAIYPWILALLFALLYGPALLGAELENKTLTYLFTRPVSRWKFVFGKYLAVIFILIPAMGLSLFISWLFLERPGGWNLFAANLLASCGGILAYNALFTLLGFLVPRRAVVLSLIYAGVFEVALSFVPALVNNLTVNYYLRSIVFELVDIQLPEEAASAIRLWGGASLTTSLCFLAGVTLVSLWLSSSMAARREYVIAEQV